MPKGKPVSKKAKPEAVELVPDAWGKFERFIKQVVKAGPQHRSTSKKRGAEKKG